MVTYTKIRKMVKEQGEERPTEMLNGIVKKDMMNCVVTKNMTLIWVELREAKRY